MKGAAEMKKIMAFLGCLALILSASAPKIGAATREMHWYTTRNKEHRQALVPDELAVVEEHGGVYIDHRHGDGDAEKVIYLTFDVGYENGNVGKTLNTLKEKRVTGAFFLLKHFVTQNSDLVLRMKGEGHLICNHTATHKNLSHATREEIQKTLSDKTNQSLTDRKLIQ